MSLKVCLKLSDLSSTICITASYPNSVPSIEMIRKGIKAVLPPVNPKIPPIARLTMKATLFLDHLIKSLLIRA